jgi:hypothetical protein
MLQLERLGWLTLEPLRPWSGEQPAMTFEPRDGRITTRLSEISIQRRLGLQRSSFEMHMARDIELLCHA